MSEACETKIELINLLVDDMLNENEKKDLLNHILICSNCKRYKEDILKVKNLMKSVDLKLPKDFSKKLIIKIEKENKKKKIFKFVRVTSSLIAASLVVMVSILLVHNSFNKNISLEALSMEANYGLDEQAKIEAIAPLENMAVPIRANEKVDTLAEYNCLLINNEYKEEKLIELLKSEYDINDYTKDDNYIIINISISQYKMIIDQLKLVIVEENIENEENIIVKILLENGE